MGNTNDAKNINIRKDDTRNANIRKTNTGKTNTGKTNTRKIKRLYRLHRFFVLFLYFLLFSFNGIPSLSGLPGFPGFSGASGHFGIFTMVSYAASSPIKNVKIKISSKLYPGDELPNIEIVEGSEKAADGEVYVSASDNKYELTDAKWVGSKSSALKSGDEPKLQVTLTPVDVSVDYFQASYRSSNINVSGGSFVSAKRDGNDLLVTMKIKMVTGQFDPPTDVYWKDTPLGTIKWDKPDNTSGNYEAVLYRDKKKVYTVAHTSSTTYNFYPYMTKPGDYYVMVRTVAITDEQKKYGKNSDYVQSGDLKIGDRDVSDGKGQQATTANSKQSNASLNPIAGTNKKVGWYKEGKVWHYSRPDGTKQTGWAGIDGYYYYFDEDGNMMTGWLNLRNKWYYMYDSGQMAVGWVKMGQDWYYFIPYTEIGEGDTEGEMVKDTWRVIGQYYYYFGEDGKMRTGWFWNNGNWYYLNDVSNSLRGVMLTGWIVRDGKTFFLDPNGVLIYGWNEIDGRWYYFYPENGQLAKNTTIDGFWVDENGIWRK